MADLISVVPPAHWNGKEKAGLQEILDKKPDLVYIDGRTSQGGRFSGAVSDLKYGVLVVVKYRKVIYGFKQRTDGTWEVQ